MGGCWVAFVIQEYKDLRIHITQCVSLSNKFAVSVREEESINSSLHKPTNPLKKETKYDLSFASLCFASSDVSDLMLEVN
jgi:hypothetical protein